MAASTKIWVNNSPPQCSAEDLNGFKNENNNLITSVGIGLDTADNNQTAKAVSTYAGAGDYYVEGGSGNGYILTPTTIGGGTMFAPVAYRDGMRVRFIATHDNSGAATINVNTIGIKDLMSTKGFALEAGAIVTGQYYQAVYFATPGKFYLQTDISVQTPIGGWMFYDGYVLPENYLWRDGSAVSRTTYADLYAATTLVLNGTSTVGLATITGLSSTARLYVGQQVTSPNFTGIVTIVSKDSGTQVTVSANAGVAGASDCSFYRYGAGDGSTTFNVGNTAGRSPMGAGTGVGLTERIAGKLLGTEGESPNLTQLTPHVHELSRPSGTDTGTGNYQIVNRNDVQDSTLSTGGGLPFPIIHPVDVADTIIRYA